MLSPEELVTAHYDELIACIANKFNLPATELELVEDKTLEEQDGSLSVIITHPRGVYMVNFKDGNGTFTDVSASDLTQEIIDQKGGRRLI